MTAALHLALAALVLLSAVAIAPNAVAAKVISSFTSDLYGYSVSWDSGVWESTLGTGDSDGGISFATDVSSVVITGFNDATNDLNGCVSRLATKRKHNKGISDFKSVSDQATVETPVDGSISALYSLTDGSSGKPVERLLYVECRPGNTDQLIRISFETDVATYVDQWNLFDAIYKAIALGGATASDTGNSSSSSGPQSGPSGRLGDATKTATPEKPAPTATKTTSTKPTKSDPVLKGDVYTGANKAFTVTFDASIWNDVTAIAPDGTGYEGIDINSDNSIGSIEVFPVSISADDCIQTSISGMKTADGFSEVAENSTLDKPATAKDAVGVMVDFVFTTDSGPLNLTRYLECRPLVKGESLIRVELDAASSRIADVLPAWSDLIAGIKIAKTPSGGVTKATATATPKSKKAPKATATAEGDAFPDVQGNTYTSPAFGFTLTWPSKFSPLLASGDKSGDVIAIGDGTSTALVFTKSTSDGTTVDSCLADKESALKTSNSITDAAVVTDSDNAELRGTTSTGLYVLYSYTNDKGALLYEYLRCDASADGSFIVDFSFITPASKFNATIDDLTAILDGFKFA